MEKNRLEAFSDGVIAIIITIMVLELKAPHSAGFDALQGWIAEHRTLWERRLDAMGDVLDDDE